jgi:CubicO group peptidase (beta-lactamase class C family)
MKIEPIPMTSPIPRRKSTCHWFLQTTLLTAIGLQSAFAVDTRASAEAGVMQGFPPALDKRVTKANAFQPPYLRWAASHAREVTPTRNIGRADSPLALLDGARHGLDELAFPLGEASLTLARYLQDTATDGFIVLHKGAVIYERYFDAFSARQPHIWASMTKSVTGLLAAQLIAEGKLDPTARLAHYVPELAGTPFGQASVQQNLDMEVAVTYPEGVPPDLGLFAAAGLIPRRQGMPGDIYSFLKVARTSERVQAPLFFYQNGSPEALAWALRKITGQTWGELVEERIWSRFAADDAYVQVDELGTEMASGGISSDLRDTARFAELVRREQARTDAGDSFTQAVRSVFAANDNQALVAKGSRTRGWEGYSYRNYWYQKNDGAGSVEAHGRFGQKIYINPERQLVIVKLSSTPDLAPRATSAGAAPKARNRAIDSPAAFNSVVDVLLKTLPR